MKQKNVVASICFPDEDQDHAKCFEDLFKHYGRTEGLCGDVAVTIGVDGDRFIIKVMKGFDCISLSVKDVLEVIKKGDKP